MYHNTVMREEAIEGLCPREGGCYVDATFGGAGHACTLLDALKGGKVFGFDSDKEALVGGKALMAKDNRFSLIHSNFKNITTELSHRGYRNVDGILADLGMSTHQLRSLRGFASHGDLSAPLDMRMSSDSGITAAMLLSEEKEAELGRIFRRYGELTAARAMARHLCAYRKQHPLQKVGDLREALARFIPKRKERRFFAQVFQALRIAVNDELSALVSLLRQSASLLLSKGRLVIISYHSLEDRLVKRFLRYGDPLAQEVPHNMYGPLPVPFQMLYKKPILASAKEMEDNASARSAKMRIGIKQ